MPMTAKGELKKVAEYLDLPKDGTTSELMRHIAGYSRREQQVSSSDDDGKPVLPEQYARRIFYTSFGIVASVAWSQFAVASPQTDAQTSWFKQASQRSGVASCTVQSVAGSPSSLAQGATG